MGRIWNVFESQRLWIFPIKTHGAEWRVLGLLCWGFHACIYIVMVLCNIQVSLTACTSEKIHVQRLCIMSWFLWNMSQRPPMAPALKFVPPPPPPLPPSPAYSYTRIRKEATYVQHPFYNATETRWPWVQLRMTWPNKALHQAKIGHKRTITTLRWGH